MPTRGVWGHAPPPHLKILYENLRLLELSSSTYVFIYKKNQLLKRQLRVYKTECGIWLLSYRQWVKRRIIFASSHGHTFQERSVHQTFCQFFLQPIIFTQYSPDQDRAICYQPFLEGKLLSGTTLAEGVIEVMQ